MSEHEHDYGQKRQDRPPVWRSSEGRMREVSPIPRKEGRDHLTGYIPHESERQSAPRESGRLAGSYGDVAVGVSRKKELTLTASKRRSREGPAATQDERQLRGDGARTVNLARGRFRVNPHFEGRSAVAFQESHKKPPSFLLARFKELMRTHRQDTLAEQLPFLTLHPEQEGLRRLTSRAEDLRAKAGPQSAALGEIESRKQTLRQAITEKETQRKRLRLVLQKAREDAARRSDWDTPYLNLIHTPPESEQEEPPPGEGGEDTPAAGENSDERNL